MLARLKRLFPRFSLRTLVLAVLLAGSGFGLWWRWEPWVLARTESQRFSLHPLQWVVERDRRAVAPDFVRALICGDGTIRNVKALDGPPLFCFFTTSNIPHGIPRGFIDDDTVVLDARDLDEKDTDYLIFHRRRPEYWWGIAWLPEFWLTLVFGGGLGCSVWRDRRG